MAVMLIFLLGIGLELLGKLFLYHPGPPSLFLRYNLGFYFPSGIVQTGHSYPSGHSYRSAFLTYLLCHLIHTNQNLKPRIKRGLIVLLLTALLIMLFSRISLGEHWSTDVIGGLLLGIILATLAIRLSTTGFLRPNRLK